jgi:hypothetical protein
VSFTIAFTVSCQRQKYLRQALDSWSQVRGVQEAHLLFCLEPLPFFSRDRAGGPLLERPGTAFPVAEFRAFLQRSFRSTEVIVNDKKLGPTGNTREAMHRAFAAGAEFTILAEEDLVVATDILEWFAWAQRYRDMDGCGVTTVSAHAHRSAGTPAQAVRVPWFSPLAWGTWPDRWAQFIEPGWGGLPDNAGAWDAQLRDRIVDAGLCSVFPARSRSQHIGELSTLTPGLLAEHFYKASQSDCFSPHYPPQEFTEVPGDSIEILV